MARELKIIVDVDTLQARAELRGLDSAIDQNVKHTDQLGDAHERASTRVAKGAQQQGELTRLIKEYVTAAIIGTAIRETLAYASSLEKLKASLDVSYRGLQQLENIGVSTNVQVATMSTGIQELTRRLGDGDKSAISALHQLGLEVEYFKRLTPDQQFITVARALGQVSSDTDKASLAAALFGRAWRELLPTFTTEIDKFADAVHVMSDNQVKDIARVEQKIETFILTMKRLGVQAGAGFAFAVQHPFTADPATDPNAWLNGVPPLGKGDVNPFTDRPDPTAVVGAWIATHTGRGPHESGMGEADFALEALKKQEEQREAAAKKWLELSTTANGVPIGWQSSAALQQWVLGQQGVLPSQTYMGNGYGPIPLGMTEVAGARSYMANPQGGDFAGIGTGPAAIGNRTFDTSGGFWSQTGLTTNSLSQGITMTAMGGGNQGQSMGAMIGGGLADPLGAMAKKGVGGGLGSVLGSAIPILGTILGGLAGTAIGKLFGPSEETSKVSPDRDTWFKQAGHDLDELNPKIFELTGSLDLVKHLFDAKTVKDWTAAVKDVEDVLGTELKAQQLLNDAVQRYGFTVDELGPKWQQQHLDEASGQLLQDYQLLIAAGVDNDTVLKRMAGSFETLALESMKTGSTIPEQLRAPLDRLREMGLLVDANGQALQDLSTLNFAESLGTKFDRLIDTIDRLAKSISGTLVQSFDVAGTRADQVFRDREINIGVNYSYEDQLNDHLSHGGSIVRSWGLERFHTGGLLPDERMIIAQTGEGVLSRRGMAALGAQNFHALNRGDAGGSSVTVAPGAVVVHSVIESASERRRLSAAIADDLMRDIQNRTRVNR